MTVVLSEHSLPATYAEISCLLPHRIMTHHPKAGLNPLVDAAGYLFTIIGNLKQTTRYTPLDNLQKEFIQEIHLLREALQHHHYSAECIMIAHYVMCAFIDDNLTHSLIGGEGRWQPYTLLTTFNQDSEHQEKFFHILEKIITQPTEYIDLMELMYLCLNLGYKGPYHTTAQCQHQLEQITDQLYKHIRAYRGNAKHTLSPPPMKNRRRIPQKPSWTWKERFNTSLVTVCVMSSIVMAMFVGLSIYLQTQSQQTTQMVYHVQAMIKNK